ncbi:hypothetical protein TNCV_4206121 [Trichonephila clavipes]|nr:hypothetical protein TNCV_4206121 [Trichonephila clavipes]
MGPKVLWAFVADSMGAGWWRIFLSLPVPCLNYGGGNRWCRHLSNLTDNFPSFPKRRTCQQPQRLHGVAEWYRYRSDRGLPCHEFEPSTIKDPPCRAAMHVKSVES